MEDISRKKTMGCPEMALAGRSNYSAQSKWVSFMVSFFTGIFFCSRIN